MIDKKKIGERIVEAREIRGIRTPGALAKLIIDAARERGLGEKFARLSRQTVEHWESGSVCPPVDKLELLAAVFGDEYDEEWIMFGQRRRQQISDEKPLMVYLTKEEAALVNDFRHSNPTGRRSIRINARAVAEDQPADEASVHTLRRKNDLASK